LPPPNIYFSRANRRDKSPTKKALTFGAGGDCCAGSVDVSPTSDECMR